ncbi:ABC transporter permease [Luteimonas sp. A277]
MRYAVDLGFRGLRRHPRTTTLAVLLLALGLSAVMSMLTLLAMLSSNPLPGISEHLYQAWVDSRLAPTSREAEEPAENEWPFLWKLGDAEAMMALQPQVRQTALVSTLLTMSVPDGTHSHSTMAVLAEGPMPSMFGVPLHRGRFWTEQEGRDGTPVVILAKETAAAMFGGDDALGREVRIGSTLFHIVGISGEWEPQPRFHFLAPGQLAWGARADSVFVPLRAALDAGVAPLSTRDCDSTFMGGYGFDTVNLQACRWLALWTELPDPPVRAAYSDALAAYARARHEAGVFERPPASRLDSVQAWLSANRVVPDSVRLNLWLAGGLLALCMVNVAGMLAARFLRRSNELGVRRVLGAPRRSVMVQCLVEAGAIGLLGGLLALPLTLFGLWLIRLQDHGYTDLARFDPRLFLVLCALSVATGLLVGVLPALRAARIEPVLQVKSL